MDKSLINLGKIHRISSWRPLDDCNEDHCSRTMKKESYGEYWKIYKMPR